MKQGDTVEATKFIERVDKVCHLHVGQRATVTRCDKGGEYEIVAISFDTSKGPQLMIDICVKNGIPLKVVE